MDFPILYYHMIAAADIGSLKSLHTLFDKYLDHMLVKFEQNHMVQTTQNFELFDKKWLTNFDKMLTPLHCRRRFCDCNKCVMLDYKF